MNDFRHQGSSAEEEGAVYRQNRPKIELPPVIEAKSKVFNSLKSKKKNFGTIGTIFALEKSCQLNNGLLNLFIHFSNRLDFFGFQDGFRTASSLREEGTSL